MPEYWKPHIIRLTEFPEARKSKIDASFFPPVPEQKLTEWEKKTGYPIPGEIRSFLAQSDGLEAQEGELWPVLPFQKWHMIDDPCASSVPMIRFGESGKHAFFLSLGHSPSIYREELFGPGEEFFTSSFSSYLEKIFQGKADS